ncbi:MAG: fatty oxidation complex subunit alpha [Bdellovibrionaceae bacterium]|nr:fatty oxidation complex subunit alpha [Pseudobdellovibrionaceae bacterium]|tara:strand:- start:4988 stop:7132 length:2145 start_codon:yes stop_codon:yes gene_type:complete
MAVEGINVIEREDGVAVLELDLAGEKVNKFSTPVMQHFDEMLEKMMSAKYKGLVVISRKPKIFIAGADINEIKDIVEPADAKQKAAEGQRILSKFEDLPFPVVVAIHGACMGGGCEMALACDYRICTDDKSTRIGLPEVQLGIIPGFGGCVRLPRVVGIQAALDIILAGKAVDSRKAKKIGLVDDVVPQSMLEEAAIKKVLEVAGKGKRKKKFQAKGFVPGLLEGPAKFVVFNQAEKMVKKNTKGHYPAPLKALEAVKKTYGMSNREKALDIEASLFSEVAITDISKNLIHIFFMTESIKKQTGVHDKDVKPKAIKNMGVLGAGTMGGGIAQLGADKGIEVRVKDLNNDALSKAFVAAASIWEKKLKRRRMTKFEFKEKMGRVSGGTDYAGFGRMDLVVEAIVEDMKIKQSVIGETAKHMPEDAIIATNTSSLSVTEMAKGHPKPENFGGMHFFNPVHKMPLVEVIRGEKTSDVTTATIFDLSKKMGKFPVVVKDGPGFLVNRLLLPYLNEAMYLLEEGMSIEEVDKYYLKFGMPMGPFHLIDEVGIDVSVKVAKIFHEAFGERAKPSPLMSKIMETGRLGKKNQKGFYLYDEKGKKLELDQSVYKDLGLSTPTNPYNAELCVNRGIFAMLNEAVRALVDDKIVEKAEEVDLAMIMGTGFPPFKGGLMKYADSIGTRKITDELLRFADDVGARFKPAESLMKMADGNEKFYDKF